PSPPACSEPPPRLRSMVPTGGGRSALLARTAVLSHRGGHAARTPGDRGNRPRPEPCPWRGRTRRGEPAPARQVSLASYSPGHGDLRGQVPTGTGPGP